MKKVRATTQRFQTAAEFGSALGLSELDMEMARQKKALIAQLIDARCKRGLSQAEVASRVGSKQPAIARMESGQVSQVSMDFLLKVALVLGVKYKLDAADWAA